MRLFVKACEHTLFVWCCPRLGSMFSLFVMVAARPPPSLFQLQLLCWVRGSCTHFRFCSPAANLFWTDGTFSDFSSSVVFIHSTYASWLAVSSPLLWIGGIGIIVQSGIFVCAPFYRRRKIAALVLFRGKRCFGCENKLLSLRLRPAQAGSLAIKWEYISEICILSTQLPDQVQFVGRFWISQVS